MKWIKGIAVLFSVLLVVACVSSISWTPVGGVMEAKNYEVRENYGTDGKIVSRVYSPADKYFTDGLKIVTNNLGAIAAILNPPKPPEPVPPAPVPPTPPAPPTPPVPPVPPTPYPPPGPTPPPVESKIFTRTGTTITLDLNTLPASMRKAGWQGRDNALYYAMGSIYLHGPGPGLPVPSGGDAELAKLSDQRAEIYRWFDAETMKVKSTMMTYPAYTVVAVTNDGRDRLGSRLGPAIADRLKEFGGRVTTGYMMPESEY